MSLCLSPLVLHWDPSLISFLSLISCYLQMWVCSTLVIPPLATGLPQLGHHDGPATGVEVTRAFNLAVPSVLITHCSVSEWALVSSPSGCLLDTSFYDKKQPINCAGGGTVPTVVAGIWHCIHSSHWDQITGKNYPLLSHICIYTHSHRSEVPNI